MPACISTKFRSLKIKNMGTLKQQEKRQNTILVAALGAVILIALLVFGFGKNEWGHTGFEVVFHQGAWFLITMLFFFALAVAAAWYGWRVYSRTQEFFGVPLALAIVAIIFIGIAFGKGCDVKGSDGVTGPKGRPEAVQQ